MNNAIEKIIIYTDGGARGNPGSAGSGAVIKDGNGVILKEVSESLGVRTNNWAEYQAVYIGLCALKKMFGKEKLKDLSVEVRSDSELIIRQLRGEYQIKEETLFSQFIKIWNLRVSLFKNIMFTSIPREENKEADLLANKAMDENDTSQSIKTLF